MYPDSDEDIAPTYVFTSSWRSMGSERDIVSLQYTERSIEDPMKTKLPFKTYFGFGYGGIGQYIWGLLFGFFMTPFLVQVAQISPFATGTLQLVASIWTAIINPFIGIFSDMTPHPRRMIWILFCKIDKLDIIFIIYVY